MGCKAQPEGLYMAGRSHFSIMGYPCISGRQQKEGSKMVPVARHPSNGFFIMLSLVLSPRKEHDWLTQWQPLTFVTNHLARSH